MKQPELFGKFTLLEKLAAGGMAEVYLARTVGSDNIGKFVAIKRILPQYATNKDFIDMFRNEAKTAIHLHHSNIVSIREFGIHKKQFFIVMDFVSGRNLRQVVSKLAESQKSFGVDHIAFIGKEIAAGLDHAHRCLDGTTGQPLHIIHRDISPQNVMVSYDGEVTIVDFGIAKSDSRDEFTRTGVLKGKFGYMSPEQVEGQEIDLRTDLFSLGIVLWELLAKRRLFSGKNEIETFRKISLCDIPPVSEFNPEVPIELQKIVNRALTKDLSLRYQTASQMHRDLNRFLNMQFPEFAPSDLAVLMKSIFAEDILVLRNKMMSYSRGTPYTQLSQSAPAEEGVESAPSILVAPKKEAPKIEISYSSSPKGFEIPSSSSSTPFQKITSLDAISPLGALAQQNVEVHNPANRKLTLNFTVPQPEPPAQRIPIRIVILVSLTLCFAAAGFFAFYSDLLKGTDPLLREGVEQLSSSISMHHSLMKTKPLENKPQAIGLNVISHPSGAEVFVDNQSMPSLTPTHFDLTSSSDRHSFTFKKPGYEVLEMKDVDVASLNGRLVAELKKKKVAYLNIDLKPPRKVTIYVNGEMVRYERLPIERFEVPANSKILVRAEDRQSRTFVEKSVTVQLERMMPILLDLNEAEPIRK